MYSLMLGILWLEVHSMNNEVKEYLRREIMYGL